VDIKVEVQENVFKVIIRSKMIYDVEVWGLEEALKENNEIHERFCKELIQDPRSAVNGEAELELWGSSSSGEVLCATVKCWIRIMRVDTQELARECCEWRINNL
jgi:hypothetical protein